MKPFLNLDIDLLVGQRNRLLRLAEKSDNQPERDDINGLINLCDHLIDIVEGVQQPEWVVNYRVTRRRNRA